MLGDAHRNDLGSADLSRYHRPIDDEPDLDAGRFSTWMTEIQGAIRGEHGSDVPCGDCTACCTASQFIHIGPQESAALAAIPKALLFPAPRRPRGHLLMGYDEHGRCPMLVDDACSIYASRPQACRTYDCRVFAAADLEPDEPEKVLIAERVRRWRFEHPAESDRAQHDAVRRAATYLGSHSDDVPVEMRPHTHTHLAVLSVEMHDLFDGSAQSSPCPDAIRAELIRRIGADGR